VWPLGIEFLNKVIETGLLLQAVHSGWSGCFFLQQTLLLRASMPGTRALDKKLAVAAIGTSTGLHATM
jgi:hypothetical protein